MVALTEHYLKPMLELIGAAIVVIGVLLAVFRYALFVVGSKKYPGLERIQLDPREPRVDSDREAQEISKLYQDRDVGPKPLNLQVDLVDLKFGDVQQHVGLLAVGLLTVGLFAV